MAINAPFNITAKIQKPYSFDRVLEIAEKKNDVGINSRLRLASKSMRSFDLTIALSSKEYQVLDDFVVNKLYSATIPMWFMPPNEDVPMPVLFKYFSNKWYQKKKVNNILVFVDITLQEVVE